VFAIGAQLDPPSIDCSQRLIVPTCPVKVNKPLDSPLQIEVDGEDKVPPTLCALISINAGDESSRGAVPL
jgi:hypothetical protein